MYPMTKEERDIQRKLKVLRYAEKIGDVGKTDQRGEAGLVNKKPIPKNPANQTPPEIVDKVLYLRSKYHLGSIRIVWYLARYHDIRISDAGVTRILRRNGVGRLPRGTRMRKLHTKRYNKQVPGHHIQMDVKPVLSLSKGSSPSSVSVARKSAASNIPLSMTQHVSGRSKSTTNILKPTDKTLSITSSNSSRSAFAKSGQTTAMSSRPSSTGTSRIRESVMPTSSVAHRS
jgi:hypothetical protein